MSCMDDDGGGSPNLEIFCMWLDCGCTSAGSGYQSQTPPSHLPLFVVTQPIDFASMYQIYHFLAREATAS